MRMKTQSTKVLFQLIHATIGTRSRHRLSPRPTCLVAGKVNYSSIDDGLEEIRWPHVLGGKSLPAASYDILPNIKKKNYV